MIMVSKDLEVVHERHLPTSAGFNLPLLTVFSHSSVSFVALFWRSIYMH